MSETPSPDFPEEEEAKLRALYQVGQNGISPVAQMQDNLNKLVFIAAIVTVKIFESDAFDAKSNSLLKESFDALEVMGPIIQSTFRNAPLGQGLDVLQEHFVSSQGHPFQSESSIEILNSILHRHLKVMIGPEKGHKKLETALNKMLHEKGSLHKMKDLARIMVSFDHSMLEHIFSDALFAVANYAQKLPGNPLQCFPVPLPKLGANLEWKFLKQNLWPWLKIELPLQQEERFQTSGYHCYYFNPVVIGSSPEETRQDYPIFSEIQFCHESMMDVYDVTHGIYEIERILDRPTLPTMCELQKASASVIGEERVKQWTNQKKLKKESSSVESSEINKGSLKEFSNKLDDKLNPQGQWFQRIAQNAMAPFRKNKRLLAKELFNKKKTEFNKSIKKALSSSGEQQKQHLKELSQEAWELRQLIHLVSVVFSGDDGYLEKYKQVCGAKLKSMVNDAVDLENDSSRIGVYIRDCLEQLEIIKRTVINPTNPFELLTYFAQMTPTPHQ